MPETPPAVSVIIRVKNEVGLVGRAIQSVRDQNVDAEVVVVDSGSTDGTLDVVRGAADRLLRIRSEDFTFGGALNRGAEAASAPVHVALSSHCWLPRRDWLARVLELMQDDAVGAVSGRTYGSDGRPLESAVRLDAAALRRNPRWGLTNHASAWRADVWRDLPFDEGIAASEDLLFAHQLVERGWLLVIDPLLAVPAMHRYTSGVRALYARKRREVAATARALDLPPFTLRDAARWWWSDVVRKPGMPFPTARVDPLRLAALAGIMAGYRDAGRLFSVKNAKPAE